MIQHRRDLAWGETYTLNDLPELLKHNAKLYLERTMDWDRDLDATATLEWELPETDEAWAARLAKLDKQAAQRAVTADKRKAQQLAAREKQEATERELYDRLKQKYG
jgi:hypothetical protein